MCKCERDEKFLIREKILNKFQQKKPEDKVIGLGIHDSVFESLHNSIPIIIINIQVWFWFEFGGMEMQQECGVDRAEKEWKWAEKKRRNLKVHFAKLVLIILTVSLYCILNTDVITSVCYFLSSSLFNGGTGFSRLAFTFIILLLFLF